MSEENKNRDDESFLAYNMSITKLKMADSQYSEETKEMCEVAVLSVLVSIYELKDVYYRILDYMRQNNIYERYARPIFELQFNPPKPQNNECGLQQGEEGKPTDKEKQEGGGVGTKVDKYDKISKKLIQDMFRIDDDDL